MGHIITLILDIEAPTEYDAVEIVLRGAVTAYGPKAFAGIAGQGHGVPDTARIEELTQLTSELTGAVGVELMSGIFGLQPGDPDPES